MDFNFDLNLVQSQKLILTPQLKQAIDILKMNSQELFEYVEEQLESNPVLEIAESDGSQEEGSSMVETGRFEWYCSTDPEDDFGERSDEDNEFTESYSINSRFSIERVIFKLTLKEHLLFQLHISDIPHNEALIGEYLIDNINENGYLAVTIPEVASFFNITSSRVERILKLIQSFDPPGICARDLKECLCIQLKQVNSCDDNMMKLVNEHLDDLAAGRYLEVADSMGLEPEKIVEMFSLIKTLEPRPGRSFYKNDGVKFIIPDVIVKKTSSQYEVLVNEDSVPAVSINNFYRDIIKEVDGDARKFIQNKIFSAAWLIKCIEQRKEISRKVVECMISRQLEFLEKGKRYIRPLSIRTIARDSGIHESIVSRTVIGKYMQCAWGIFELRCFFT